MDVPAARWVGRGLQEAPEAFPSDPVEMVKSRIAVSPFYEGGHRRPGRPDRCGERALRLGLAAPEGLAEPTYYAKALEHLPVEDQAKIMGGNLSRLVNV